MTVLSEMNNHCYLFFLLLPLLILFAKVPVSSAQNSGSNVPNNAPDEIESRAAGNTASKTDSGATGTSGNETDGKTGPLSVMIFGDSITAGYGLETGKSFPSLIREKADSLGLNVQVTDAGVSGETTAGGLTRIDWVLQREVDLFVLELGANDGLRGIDPENTKANLGAILSRVQSAWPEAVILLAGMEAPPNLGETYTSRFREIYRELAADYNILFMPFILEGVAGIPSLNQPDGIHPTAEGHRIIAENLWIILQPVLSGMHRER